MISSYTLSYPKKLILRDRVLPFILLTILFNGAILLPQRCSSEPFVVSSKRSRLLLFLVVDQFGYEYIERMKPFWKGGLKELIQRGVVFNEVHHGHGITTTCPGHATLSTGTHPSRSGMIDNGWYDRKKHKIVNCVDERSPSFMKVPTLGDWLKERSPKSKVYSVSAKDRAAIPLAGRQADGAFWYDSDRGAITTSNYYPYKGTLLKNFFSADNYFGKVWTPLKNNFPELIEQAGFLELNSGPLMPRFPHPIGGVSLKPDKAFYTELKNTPFIDEYITEFSLKLINEERLGEDEYLDILYISFSGVDLIGHLYGPNSPEMFDTLIRLDNQLITILSAVKAASNGNTLIALSADHGVQPYPEYVELSHSSSHRINALDSSCIANASLKAEKISGIHPLFISSGYFSDEFNSLSEDRRKEVKKVLQSELLGCGVIESVLWSDELGAFSSVHSTTTDSSTVIAYQHSFDPERSPDIILHPKKHTLPVFVSGTTHGTPYPYDTHVPFVLYGSMFESLLSSTSFKTVEIAPLLATLLGISPSSTIDAHKDKQKELLQILQRALSKN